MAAELPVGDGCSEDAPIVLLTRREHRDGHWIKALARAIDALAGAGRPTLILDVDDVAAICETGQRPHWACLVNRVSDAAPPEEAKLTLAALRLAELHGIPVVNGSKCYSVGTHKVMHHSILRIAELRVPKSVVLKKSPEGVDAAAQAAAAGLRYPVICKPNAGGFGKGIRRFDAADDLAKESLEALSAASNDGVVLLQEQRQPDDGNIYRIWFLGDQVQFAVRTPADGVSFEGKCACTMQDPGAWQPPAEIASAVQRLAALAEADCGSVELLFEEGQPVFFDFNCLSSMPTVEAAGGRDLYAELGAFIVSRAKPAT
eukprot:TRINITY_DN4714_c0_g1_i2.p1 TRINITY_DN4714_c0_g1~~TRINITY_DN4714_c0_g1_i2.p1  ORF type:complete len:339 (-),score=81.54 TRINITY_DN4714_c0_g1_i2:149-1099(-)